MADQIPIYVISLESAEDRRKSIRQQFDSIGLDFQFFNAVNGRDPIHLEHYRHLIDGNWREKRRGDPMTPTAIACALSHALLYKKMIQKGLSEAIILEDDAVISNGFAALANRRWLIPNDVHLFILHAYHRQYVKKGNRVKVWKAPNAEGDRYLYDAYGRMLGTCSYYLDLYAAKKLYEAAIPIWTVADWPLNISSVLNAKGVEPPVVNQSEEFLSQIQAYKKRKIPIAIIIMRLFIIPTLMFPHKFGSPWKAVYAWGALKLKTKAFLFARQPRSEIKNED